MQGYWAKIVGDKESVPLKQRVLSASIVLAAFINLSSFVVELVFYKSVAHYISSMITLVVFMVLYFFSRRSISYKLIQFIYSIILVAVVISSWFFYNGAYGIALPIALCATFIISFLFSGLSRILFLVLLLLSIATLSFLQAHGNLEPQFFISEAFNIYATFFIFIALMAGMVVINSLIYSSYEHNNSKLLKLNKKIRKRNKIIEKVNKDKSKFFSIIAHDLRSPIGAMAQLSELYLENKDQLTPKQYNEWLVSVYQNSNRIFTMLNNLLQWARSESGLIQPVIIKTNISQIVHEMEYLFKQQAAHKQISIQNHMPDQVYAYADVEMTKTILRNLISNAIKFTPGNGKIEISAYLSDRLVVHIKDTGVGIPGYAQKKLFSIKSDYRTNGTDHEQGSGLGLKLCNEFVAQMNGEIWVESEPDKGARFCFTLPLKPNSN